LLPYCLEEGDININTTLLVGVEERIWKGYGKDMERIWKGYGKDMERIWKGYGKDIERI
jgi:hypothetical protein